MKMENENFRKRVNSLILNTKDKNENNKGKIDEFKKYQKNNYENLKIEKRNEVENAERRAEKTYKIYSRFPQSICAFYNTIYNFILKIEQTKHQNIKIDTNKSNKNHDKNKDYILLKNNIINKNYF